MLASLLRRIAAVLSRSRREDELRSEIELHIQLRTRALVEDGMDPREAAWEARRRFGNSTVIREETRDMWSFRWIDTLAQDARYGLRLLRRTPVFTAAAVASLALGVGAAAAVFSLTDALFIRNLPVRAPQELVLFRWTSGPQAVFESLSGNGRQRDNEWSSTSFSWTAYDRIRKELAADVETFAFADLYRVNIAIDGRPETAEAQIVSGNYFDALGVKPAAGRLLGPADDRADAAPVAVLGYDMWRRKFGGSPDVVGRALVLNSISFTIAGVLPRGFRGTMQVGQGCDVMVPLWTYQQVTHSSDNVQNPNFWWVLMMGRLKPGVTREKVQAAADLILKQTVAAARPQVPPEGLPKLSVERGSRAQTEVRASLIDPARIMAGVVAVVLLIACANVANLLLARGRARAREFAVRSAIGAPRSRLVRQLLTEGLLLGFVSSALGLVMAGWMAGALLPALSSDLVDGSVAFALDPRVVLFTCVLGIVCSMAFGLAPAIRSSDAHITTGLQEGTRGAVGGRRRFTASGGLVVAQVALSLLLVTAAGLLGWSAVKLQRVNTGFDARNILTFTVDTSLSGYDDAKARAFFEEALGRLRALPGVVNASLSSHRLVANSSAIGMARPAGAPAPSADSPDAPKFASTHRAYMLNVDETFLQTMKIPLLRGRTFSVADAEEAPRVGLVNEALAVQLFGTADAVGRQIVTGLNPKNRPIEIVGVTANAVYTSIRRPTLPVLYLPFRQVILRGVTFELRTAADPASITASARDALRNIDDTLPIVDVRTLEEQINRSLLQERVFAKLALLLAGTAVGLSAIGVYGLLAYAVARRTAEIGVRMALGAGRRQVRWMVLRQSLVLTGVGLALGIPAARLSAKVLESLLFGLQPNDPRVMGAAALVMTVVAFAAAYLPARRASRIDPLTALRAE